MALLAVRHGLVDCRPAGRRCAIVAVVGSPRCRRHRHHRRIDSMSRGTAAVAVGLVGCTEIDSGLGWFQPAVVMRNSGAATSSAMKRSIGIVALGSKRKTWTVRTIMLC